MSEKAFFGRFIFFLAACLVLVSPGVADAPVDCPLAKVLYYFDGVVTLDWEPVPDATSYFVYRSDDPSLLELLAVPPLVEIETPPWTDDAVPGPIAYYRVTAANTEGEGPLGNFAYRFERSYVDTGDVEEPFSFHVSFPDIRAQADADEALLFYWVGNDNPMDLIRLGLGPDFECSCRSIVIHPVGEPPFPPWLLAGDGPWSLDCREGHELQLKAWTFPTEYIIITAGADDPRLPAKELPYSEGWANEYWLTIPGATPWATIDDALYDVFLDNGCVAMHSWIMIDATGTMQTRGVAPDPIDPCTPVFSGEPWDLQPGDGFVLVLDEEPPGGIALYSPPIMGEYSCYEPLPDLTCTVLDVNNPRLPVIEFLDPYAGPMAGETPVKIYGEDFHEAS